MTRIQALLLGEAASYVIAALFHAGVVVRGYHHREASIAESLIAAVLLTGLVVGLLRPRWTRLAALWSQSFALLLTFVGVFVIVIGVGPRTVPDVVYHIAIVAVLIYGLVLASRPRSEARLS
jgi:hypothetical protein